MYSEFKEFGNLDFSTQTLNFDWLDYKQTEASIYKSKAKFVLPLFFEEDIEFSQLLGLDT